MKKTFIVLALFAATLTISCGEPKFKKLKSGLEYKIVKKGKGDKKVTEGSMITMNMKTMLKDSVLFDSYKMNNGEPMPAQITKPAFNGDLMEGMALLSEGDSAVIRVPADSLFHNGQQMPEFIKKGDIMQFCVKIVSVKSEEEYKKQQEEASSKQIGIDDKIIQDYLAANHLTAQKTPSGVYYIIEKTGNGKHPVATDKVKVNYKGSLLDGTKFDASADHGGPAEFALNQVIKGWIDGIPMFDEGGKGKLIVPSSLAYGKNPPPGSPIKPDAVLLFDIDLIAITTGSAPAGPAPAGH